MTSYFITGIGTNVGKTFCAAVLTEALSADYWKPVQTGALEDSDTMMLRSLITNSTTVFFKETYNFKEPASPNISAALENQIIVLDHIKLPSSQNQNLIIEGAGGLLVPLNDQNFVIDLAKKFDAEVILVCKNYLGCINHSLLSIAYLLKNNHKIKGIIFNGNFEASVKKSILNYASVPVLADIPEVDAVSKETVLKLSQAIDKSMFK